MINKREHKVLIAALWMMTDGHVNYNLPDEVMFELPDLDMSELIQLKLKLDGLYKGEEI